jgi:succinoglycan biosynthesis transport protein ExoP
MEQVISVVANAREIVRRRLPIAGMIGAALLTITAVLTVGLPSYYKSRAVILIEAQEMPQDLVRSLVTSFADQRIQVISQRVLTNSNLSSILEKYDLYAEERKSQPLETVLEQMRKDVTVTPISADVVDPKAGRSVQATIAFELAYESRVPALAQRVANEIASLFLSENLRQRTETSEQSLNFLTEESEKIRGQVAELERRLSEFKQGNVEQLPELSSLNLELINRTENDLRTLDSQIQSLEQQRVYLESETAQQKPMLGVFSETGERILGPADRLKVLEAELTPLSAKYGATHPDVISKRREVESLREQVGVVSSSGEVAIRLKDAEGRHGELLKKYSPDHPDVKRLKSQIEALTAELSSKHATGGMVAQANERPDNPAFIQLQARLQGTNTDLQALQEQKRGLRSKLIDLERRITNAPEVERQYRALTRDYEAAQAKYQEIQAKRQEAEVASTLESEQKGERFTLIEPPIVPEQPSRPNRLAVGSFGAIVSIAAALGFGMLAESADGRIYGRIGVTRLLGVPPLAVIPQMDTPDSTRSRRRWMAGAIAGFFLLVLVGLTAVHIFVRPVDVLFFQIVRRLGL